MLKNYMESDFELNYLDKSRLCFIKKLFTKNYSFFFNIKNTFSFFFQFANIIDIDMFWIHRFFLAWWIFTGLFAKIINYKVQLRLGIYYYSFFVIVLMKKRKFFRSFSFFIDDFLSHQLSNVSFGSFYLHFFEKNVCFFFNNLESFTNYKLARGVYFYRILKKFGFTINFLHFILSFFKLFLNSLKLQWNLNIQNSYVT